MCLAALATLPLAVCTPKILPPPAAPERVPPAAEDPGPAPTGRSRVFIAVPDEPAGVDEVTGAVDGVKPRRSRAAAPFGSSHVRVALDERHASGRGFE